MPFTDIITLFIKLDSMFSINVKVTQSSTVNWQDASYTKCLEIITLTNYTHF